MGFIRYINARIVFVIKIASKVSFFVLSTNFSILSKSDRPQDVKESINRLWHLFFDNVPTDVVATELRGFEEGIMRLHDKRIP